MKNDYIPVSELVRSKIERELDRWEKDHGTRPDFGPDETRAAVLTLAAKWSENNAAILTQRHLDDDHPPQMASTDAESLVRFISLYPEFALGDGKRAGFLAKLRGWLMRLDGFDLAESRGDTAATNSEDALGVVGGLSVSGEGLRKRRQRRGTKSRK